MSGSKATVLIIGGSFAGLTAARILSKDCNVIVVDVKEFFEYTPSILECFINRRKLMNICIPLKKLSQKQKFKFVHGIVDLIEDNVVHVRKSDSTESIVFDYCIISSGSQYKEPIKCPIDSLTYFEERFKQIQNYQERVREAQNILVIGGGTVGVELATELAAKNKVITLVTRGKILSSMPERSRKIALNRMKQLKIDVQENFKGIPQKCDLVFECYGNSYKLIESIQDFLVDKKRSNTLKVNDFMQIEQIDGSEKNIFACGDICITDQRSEPTAHVAEMQAIHAAKNVLKQVNGAKKLLKIPYIPHLYCISLGGKQAMFVFENLCVSGFLIWFVKQFIEKTKMLQYTGVIGFDLLWRCMHVITSILLFLYMFMDMFIGNLTMERSLSNRETSELKSIKQEIDLRKKKQ